ncbi:MAG: hypothetical protein WBH61_06100, partial [Candidatus Methylomirabilis sp.]
GGVIAAVLHAREAFEEDVDRTLCAYVADDTAHNVRVFSFTMLLPALPSAQGICPRPFGFTLSRKK